MRCIQRLFLLLIAAVALTACNVSGNITDMTQRSTTVTIGQLTGIVSGGTVQTTAGGYQVFATCGDAVANIVNTTGGGYTVYSNVTGNYVSSSVITTIQ